MEFEFEILLPAFLAGLLVLATHIPLGMRVLQRGVIFADLAVAQIAGLGVVIAGLLDLTGWPLLVQAFAAASALCGAALLAWIEQAVPDMKEACIGLIFVLSASMGILLMSRDVHAGEHLQELLVGQILWVSSTQLVIAAVLTAGVLGLWRFVPQRQGHFVFYALFALAVTASVQMVGIYLVFASLIVPALVTFRLGQRRTLAAGMVGIAGYGAGLGLSVWLDLPAGAAIVWMLVLAGTPLLFLRSRT